MSSGDGRKQWDSGFTWKVMPMGFPDKLYVRLRRERKIKVDTQVFGLNN